MKLAISLCLITIIICCFASTSNAGGALYYWKPEVCNVSCNFDTRANWDASPEASPKDYQYSNIYVNTPMSASTSSDYLMNSLNAPGCASTRSVEATGSNLIEIKFSNNNVQVLDTTFCGETRNNIKTVITFTNSTVSGYDGGSWNVRYGATLKFIDSTVNFNFTNLIDNTQVSGIETLNLQFINTTFTKYNISAHTQDKEAQSGFILYSNNSVLVDWSSIYTPCPIYIPPQSKITLSGNSTISYGGTVQLCKANQLAMGINGQLNVKSGAYANIPSLIIGDVATTPANFTALHTIESNGLLSIAESLTYTGKTSVTTDIYGTLNVTNVYLAKTHGSESVQVNLHLGSVTNIKGELIFSNYLLTKRGGIVLQDGTVVNAGGSLFVDGPVRFESGLKFNSTGGTSTFNGKANSAAGFNFIGGDVVFGSDFTDTTAVTINAGTVTFAGITSVPSVTVAGGGLKLQGGELGGIGVVVNAGAYVSGYGVINGDLTVNANGEVRLTSLSQTFTVTGKADIKTGAKVIFYANSGIGHATVGTLSLANGVVFDVVYQGAGDPVNNSQFTVLKYDVLSGTIPSSITEFGVTYTFTNDEIAKEIKVQISVEKGPSGSSRMIIDVFAMCLLALLMLVYM